MDGDVGFVVKDTAYSCGEVKSEHGNDKRSFTVTISDDGRIEVTPSTLSPKPTQPKPANGMPKLPRNVSKQRIRIALIEDDAGSSDEETDENDAMLNGFANIYNKNVPAKPSFVVLEDTIVRKRFEDILQASAFHCNAQQQTSPCEIGAHTGSQTDDVQTSRVKGHSRGCQVTDARSNSNQNANRKKNINSLNKLLQHLSNLQSPPALAPLAPLETPPDMPPATAKAASPNASHVTISFVGPPSATSSVVYHPQVGQPQLPPTVNYVCSKCGNCCCQLPACCNKLPPQYQQHRLQQHNGLATPNCCSSSTLRPTMGQTIIGPCAVPYVLPETKTQQQQQQQQQEQQQQQQQQQDYLIPNWTPQPFTPCPYCPLNPCNRCPCGNPHCPNCCMLRHCSLCSIERQWEQQMQHQQQLQKLQIQNAYSRSISNTQTKQSGVVQPEAPSETPKQGVRIQTEIKAKQAIPQKDGISRTTDKLQQNPPTAMPILNAKLSSYPKISRRLLAHHPRHRANGIKTYPTSKLYMARCGRTCLILKPTMCPLSSEMPKKQETIVIP